MIDMTHSASLAVHILFRNLHIFVIYYEQELINLVSELINYLICLFFFDKNQDHNVLESQDLFYE